MDLMKYTAVALGKKIKAGEVTVKEAAQAALDQIKKSEETFRASLTHPFSSSFKEDQVFSEITTG